MTMYAIIPVNRSMVLPLGKPGGLETQSSHLVTGKPKTSSSEVDNLFKIAIQFH